MKWLIILGAITLSSATPTNDCSKKNEKEVLKTDLMMPHSLMVDHTTNTLYFYYLVAAISDEGSTLGQPVLFSRLGTIDLKDNVFHNESYLQPSNTYCHYVDHATNQMYVAGSDGIYKYDPKTDIKKPYVIGKHIRWIFIKNDLYYVDFTSDSAYVIKNDKPFKVKDLKDTEVFKFVLDKDDDIFFGNTTGLYGVQKDTKDVVYYRNFKSALLHGLLVNNNGLVFVAADDGVFFVNKDEKRLEKIVDGVIRSIAFDKDDRLIYSDGDSIYRLKSIELFTC